MNHSKILSAFFIALAAVVLLSACESNRWFQSEDKLRSKIQTTWSLILIPATDANHNPRPPEEWIFSEGKIYRERGTPLDTVDVGNYSVSTSLTKAYLSITDFQSNPAENINCKWEIIELDGGVLYIASDNNGTSGVKQLEFIEK